MSGKLKDKLNTAAKRLLPLSDKNVTGQIFIIQDELQLPRDDRVLSAAMNAVFRAAYREGADESASKNAEPKNQEFYCVIIFYNCLLPTYGTVRHG